MCVLPSPPRLGGGAPSCSAVSHLGQAVCSLCICLLSPPLLLFSCGWHCIPPSMLRPRLLALATIDTHTRAHAAVSVLLFCLTLCLPTSPSLHICLVCSSSHFSSFLFSYFPCFFFLRDATSYHPARLTPRVSFSLFPTFFFSSVREMCSSSAGSRMALCDLISAPHAFLHLVPRADFQRQALCPHSRSHTSSTSLYLSYGFHAHLRIAL